MITIPIMVNHELKASAIGVSDKYLVIYDPKGEENQLFVYSQPLLQLCKAIPFTKARQLEIAQGYLLVLGSNFQAFTLPDLQLIFNSDINPVYMNVDKFEVALLLAGTVIVFSLQDFTIKDEYVIKGEYRRVLIIEGIGLLLQSKYTLNFLKFSLTDLHTETILFELKKPSLKGILNLNQPAANVLHISQFSLICITSNNCTFFVDYQFRQYIRYPSIKHNSELIQQYFIYPCYFLSFYQTSLSIFLIHTGELITTIPSQQLNFESSSSCSQHLFIASQNSLLSFSSPSLDILIPCILRNKRFDVALEICRDTCDSLISRVYFEHGVYMFFQERDYQRATYYFRKSEEIWAVCSLLRKIIVLPPVVYEKCEEQFKNACKRLNTYSILQTHLEFISQKMTLSYDASLKSRIVQNFIPFFTMFRKSEDENLKFFSECWLFAAYLFIPYTSGEFLGLLRDPCNSLPLRYCEHQLKTLKKYEELTELFISRKIYKAGLESLFTKYKEEKTLYWLVLIKDFLMQLSSNPECFIEYLQRLFCESPEQAEQLLLGYPKILEQVDVLNVLIPIMLKFSGTLLVINFLRGRDSREESNFLAKLYIQEAVLGNVNPKDLVEFLSSRPIKYDPKVVLGYFPRNLLQREKCLVLDLLDKYEEIIHFYLYKKRNLEMAQRYVEYKRNVDVSSVFITKLCKSPMSKSALNTLVSFLNDSDPRIIDHNVAFTFIPYDLNIKLIEKYLIKAMHYLQEERKGLLIKKNLQEKSLVDLMATFFVYAEKSVEIHEDSRCDYCNKKIKTLDFVVSLKHEIIHLSCYEKENLN